MTLLKTLGIAAAVALVGTGALEIGERLMAPEARVTTSEAAAVVGRPLTPVSVAGVSRRTSRRVSRRR